MNNIDQIPATMSKLGYATAANAMKKWVSRTPGDTTPVDGLLTIKWAEGFEGFIDSIKLKQ